MAENTKKARFFVRATRLPFQSESAAGFREVHLSLDEAERLRALPAAATILAGLVKEGLERSEQPDLLGLLATERDERETNHSFVMRNFRQFEQGALVARREAEDHFGAVEAYTRTASVPGGNPALAAFAAWWERNDFRLIEARTTEHTAEFAGRVDLAVLHPEYGECIVDVRSQSTPRGRFQVFVGMGMDLGARALARGERTGATPRIVTTLSSRDQPGHFHAKVWTPKEQQHMTKAFVALKMLWYAETGYGVRASESDGQSKPAA